MPTRVFDSAVIGGGILGLATARAVGGAVVVLEAEDTLAAHQTGHNSGVIHSGLYYKPGSLKADNCARGREAMYAFCEEHEIPNERCGKLVVATSTRERPWLEELERRGKANGLSGLKRLDADELREYEPHVAGVAGLHVPDTGIVDFGRVSEAIADDVRRQGGEIRTGARLIGFRRKGGLLALETTAGDFRARNLINCAGLQSDRVARLCGVQPSVRIVPFRGEYYRLERGKTSLVRNLIYPVPDPSFPFLGVHFTRMIDGGVEAGPNAVWALKREGYTRTSFSAADTASALTWPGFWKMAGRHWRTGCGELWRSWNKAAFVRALQRLVPEVRGTDLAPHGAGVRAQAVARDGSLLDDFAIERAENQLHVLNAPSPGATASLAIGETLAGMLTA
ncbi:MAG: L-2-hydroxyglutarate oxidase [Acidobacteria bacterium]|nr:L-2-hydroxyglutarate oxidase [Acidobacteriota bacterium]